MHAITLQPATAFRPAVRLQPTLRFGDLGPAVPDPDKNKGGLPPSNPTPLNLKQPNRLNPLVFTFLGALMGASGFAAFHDFRTPCITIQPAPSDSIGTPPIEVQPSSPRQDEDKTPTVII
jgi:hypothetical protein